MPSAFVKGWAAERGGALPEPAWTIGVQDTRERFAIAAAIRLTDGAVATSGTYERGAPPAEGHDLGRQDHERRARSAAGERPEVDRDQTSTPRRCCARARSPKQSANIDAVSGATYTSEGYRTALQSALDTAGFKASSDATA